MNPLLGYELQARAFHLLHGCLAPGKDQADCDPNSVTREQRQVLWDEWHAACGQTIHALLKAFGEHLKDLEDS